MATDRAPVSRIVGTIRDEAGLPVPGATLSVPGSPARATSGIEGAFSLDSVAPGKASVEVLKEGFRPLVFDFDIAAGVTVSLKLTIESVAPPITADFTSAAVVDEPSGPVGTAASRKVTLRGTVIDSSGSPIFGAIVEEAASTLRTMTDSGGRYRLQGMEPGLAFVRVRKLGYLAEYFPLTGIAGRTASATIRLRPAGQQLARVNVNAEAMKGDRRMRGYYERVAKGTGVFIDRTEIVRRNATQLSDVLRGRNGINVYGQGANGNVIAGRQVGMGGGAGPGICALPLIIDGVYVELRDGLTVDRVVNVQDVRAVEVYSTGPQVPAELATPRTACGAIVVWTR